MQLQVLNCNRFDLASYSQIVIYQAGRAQCSERHKNDEILFANNICEFFFFLLDCRSNYVVLRGKVSVSCSEDNEIESWLGRHRSESGPLIADLLQDWLNFQR